jgi:hypothetical protein
MASSVASGSKPSRSAYPGASSVSSTRPASATSTSERPNPEDPAQDTPGDPARPADGPPGASATAARYRPARDRLTLVLAWTAAILIVISVAIMIAVLAAGPSMAVIRVPMPAAGPPWWFSLHPSTPLVTFALWTAAGTGGAGVIAGLIAVARGARPSARALIVSSFLAVAILTVLPAGGSTDVLSYAANGRMAATGHSPYVMTPLELKNSGDPIGQWIPPSWQTDVSVYGPAATAEEWVTAELGGTSVARVTFLLKLLTSIAFGAVTLMLDRVLRPDPARRLRAHLLWTVNPLLLWEIVASGHIDGLSAAFGLLGILVLTTGQNGERPALRKFLLAGLFIGIAAAIKIPYAAFGIGVIWAGRKSLRALGAAIAGFALILVPAYALAGRPAISVLVSRGPGTTWDTMYQILYRPLGYRTFGAFIMPPSLTLVAGIAFGAVAILAFFRFPDRTPSLPALSPALALSLAWLFMWSYQRPWYDVMAICLLAVYPASRLDWLVLVRLILTAPVYMPGMPETPSNPPAWINHVAAVEGLDLSAYGRLAVAGAFVVLCLFPGWRWLWGWRQPKSAFSPGSSPALQSLI